MDGIARNPTVRLLMAVLIVPILLFGPLALGPGLLLLSIGLIIREGLWDE